MHHHMIRFVVSVVLTMLLIGCKQQASEQQQATTEQQEQQSPELVVEAACGQCQFRLPGKGCDLAVRIDGVAYYVDGAGIGDHGDPHSDIGFCNAVRQARVTGRVENGRFVATSFELLPSDNE